MLESTRPTSVMGPLGPLTLEDLPSSATTYWVSRRKAEVLAAIDGGLLSLNEACKRYRLSLEELAAWRRSIDRAGIAGLRVTKAQRYRDDA
ncbi:CtrA inhibitor SciP [Sphingopyxis sp.]|uniref:CtrA inhibitor SciP n=1 Tax=Sphingopyxis sp. TaxID=1908224 RepID=UPI002FCB6865